MHASKFVGAYHQLTQDESQNNPRCLPELREVYCVVLNFDCALYINQKLSVKMVLLEGDQVHISTLPPF